MSGNQKNKSKPVLLLVMMLTNFLVARSQAKCNNICNNIEENIGNIFRVSTAGSGSVGAENATIIKAKTTYTVAEVEGSGAIQHIRMIPTGNWRLSILRFYWDNEKEPSVEVPVGDFFCMGWGQYAPVQSLTVCVNPGNAFNCYWPMPFRKKCRITMENIGDKDMTLVYRVDYTLMRVSADAGYFHAQFRKINPLRQQSEYVLLDGIKGKGQYVGTYLAWGLNSHSWLGEGDVRFYLDGRKDPSSIAGTGTEDYFCGFYHSEILQKNHPRVTMTDCVAFSTPYIGLPQMLLGDGPHSLVQRYGLYRWHIADPIHFKKGIKVTIRPLGWDNAAFSPFSLDDIASTVFWYQRGPHRPFPALPGKDKLAIN